MTANEVLGVSTREVFAVDFIYLGVNLCLDNGTRVCIATFGLAAYEARLIVDFDLAFALILKLHTFLIRGNSSSREFLSSMD